jgi:energy-coupling factor transporter ATP-binding protein EcfA2
MLEHGSRLHASLPPLSEGEITIRKFCERPHSPSELSKNQAMSFRAMAMRSLIMQSDQSLVIEGNTASGKTTLLNALFSFVPLDARVLITEETPKINIPHSHQIRLVANKEMGIELKHLVYDSLRMRPDRTIVGEVRNKEEVEALFDVLHGGQARGTYATMHAQSASEAQKRLQSFGIEEWKSIDWLLVQRRLLLWKKGKREEVRRLFELMSPGLNESCISYDIGKDNWAEKKSAKVFEHLGESLGLNQKEVEKEISERARTLQSAKLQFLDSFRSIQKKFYGLHYSDSHDSSETD